MSIPAQGAVGAETMTAGQSLDLRDLHAANIARQAEWCPDQVPDLSFRGNELGGECGEAQNVIKKLERERQGWRGSRATKDDLADELADVVICADLCAVTADIDLGAAVRRKFNATSEKQGLSVFLPAPAPRTDGGMTAGEVTDLCDRLDRLNAATDPQACAEAMDEARLLILRLATPAQPAGAVPDSLRALLKEAADVISGAIGPQHPVAQKIDTAIASHRAGQSAGSGADTVPPLLRTAFAIYDSDPGSTVMYRHCERLSYEFVRKLLSAPDSTRTGDEGTEAIDRAIVSTLYGIDFEEEAESYEFCPDEGSHTPTEFEKALLIDFAHGLMNTVHAAVRPLVLAARPAAPEAQ